MQRKIKLLALITGIPLLPWAASSPNTAMDPGLLDKLTDGEFNHGQVVEAAEYLADRIGGGLSPRTCVWSSRAHSSFVQSQLRGRRPLMVCSRRPSW